MEVRRGLDVADCPQPLRHSVEVAKLLLERGDHRKARQPRGPITLLKAEISPNDALDENGRAVDRRMAGNEGKTPVNVDKLEVAGRGHGFRQNEAEFSQPSIDAAHRLMLSAPVRLAQVREPQLLPCLAHLNGPALSLGSPVQGEQ